MDGRGNASFSSVKYNVGLGSHQSGTQIQIQPNVGYFFSNKFAGGIAINYNHETALFGDGTTLFGIGPFVRYYFFTCRESR